jgi:hypothetical protein
MDCNAKCLSNAGSVANMLIARLLVTDFCANVLLETVSWMKFSSVPQSKVSVRFLQSGCPSHINNSKS